MQGPQGQAGGVASWQGFWTPAGAGTNGGGITAASGPSSSPIRSTKRVYFTPPVAGVFSYVVEGIANCNDAAWVRTDFWAQILRASDSAKLAPDLNRIVTRTGGTYYCSWRVENRCNVAAGVPVFGAAFIVVSSGTWNYWQGASYLRAFAAFTPSWGYSCK